MDEHTILAGLLQKDEKVLEFLYAEYENYVSSIIHQIIGSYMTPEDRQEVLNDTFYKLWNNADKINLSKGSILSYLSAIARNSAKNKLRECRFEEEPLQDKDYLFIDDSSENSAETNPVKQLEQKETAEEIRFALKELPKDVREIFIRYYYFYETIAQIAEKMYLRQNTVKSKLRRGRKQLEKILKERGFSS